MPETSDLELMQRIRTDDPSALGALFRRHGPRIHRYVVRRTADPEVAEVITASAFLDLWRSRHRRPADLADALPLLYGHATHLLPRLRRRRPHHAGLLQRLETLPQVRPTIVRARAVVAQEAHGALGRLVGLRRVQLDVLTLAEWERLEVGEIATALDIAPEAVESRLRKARARLGDLHDAVHPVDSLATVDLPSTLGSGLDSRPDARAHHGSRRPPALESGSSIDLTSDGISLHHPAPRPSSLPPLQWTAFEESR